MYVPDFVRKHPGYYTIFCQFPFFFASLCISGRLVVLSAGVLVHVRTRYSDAKNLKKTSLVFLTVSTFSQVSS